MSDFINEAAKKEKHYPWTIWATSRGNYRAMSNKNKQRSFKTYKDAADWLESVREKQKELYVLKLKGITPKTELRKIIGYIREQLSTDENVDLRSALKDVYKALSRIHVKMI